MLLQIKKKDMQIKNCTCKLKLLQTWNMNGPTAVRPGRTARTRSSSLILRAQNFPFSIWIDMFSIFNLQVLFLVYMYNFYFACPIFNLQQHF